MKTNHYKQQSIKLLGFITLACFSLFLSSCGTENDENFEMPSEEVLERVSAATEVAGKYFSECSSISELEKHLDEIRNTEGVVDVWTDDKTMYVKYEGFGTITYYYPIISATDIQNSTRSFGAPVEFESLSFPNAVTYSTRSEEAQYDKNHYRLNDSEKHSLVIYNALSVDERFKEDKEVINNMENTFKAFNYSTECIETSKDISQHAKFFNEDLYKYDIVVFDCHGFYYNKKHWLLTGCLYKAKDYSLTKSELEDIEKKANLVIKNHKREDYLSISLIEEKVNGIMRNAFYWSISEDFLSLNGANFNERSIVFNCACESLMGSSTLADIFCNKGAACYLGYDNTNCISMLAAEVFFQGLLNGFTVQSSYGMLEKRYTNDTSKYYEDVTPGTGNYIKDANGNFIESAKGNYIISRCNANLEIVTKNNNEDDKHVCITHPQTDSYEDKDNNYYVKLKGHIKIANPNNNNEYGFALRDKNSKYVKPLKPGIKYSNADISTGNCSYDKNTNTLNFECTVSKSDFKDVDQFCAYLYDGERYCLGELVDILVENLTGNVQGFVDYSSLIGLKSDKVIELLGEPKQQYAKYDYGYSVIPESEKLNDLLTYGLFVNMDDGRVGSVRQKVRCPKYNVISYFDKKYHLLDEGETIAYYADKSTLEESTILIYVKADDLDNEEVTEVKYEGLLDMYSVYDRETKTLTFKYGNFYYDVAHGYDINDITLDLSEGNIYARKVVFDPSFAQARPQDTYNWFYCAFSLTEIIGLEYLNTSEVVSMRRMFYDCDKLTTLDLSGFDTRNVERMSGMFSGCSSLTTLDLSSFDTGNVEDMSEMFLLCTSLTTLDLSSFDTSNVKNMYDMFYGCKNLKTIYATDKWTIDKVENKKRQFTFGGCEQLVGGMGTQWKSYGIEYARIDGGPEAPGYFTAK